MAKRAERAVVLGASMAGLLAARVLADFYEAVIVIERDTLPDHPETRRGVPQANHVHVLSARAAQVLEELLPGLLNDLVRAGVGVWDDGDLSKMSFTLGEQRLPTQGVLSDFGAWYFPSRSLLEWNVQQRIKAISNVIILDGRDFVGLTTSASNDRITGVRVTGDDADEIVLTAELVVDAAGRGSRTPMFLEDLGYGRPAVDEVTVRVQYASQRLRLPPGTLDEYTISVFPTAARPVYWVLMRQEHDTWLFTLGTFGGHEVPVEPADRLAFGSGIAPGHAIRAITLAEPLGEVARFHTPSNRWWRYDGMRKLPKGLVVCGDALCSFNPIYGQGMTVAALEALVLRDCMKAGVDDLPRRYFRAAAKVIRRAWRTAVSLDLSMPDTTGRQSISMRIGGAYFELVKSVAATDIRVTERFLRMIAMLDDPSQLMRPAFLLRVVMGSLRRPRPAT